MIGKEFILRKGKTMKLRGFTLIELIVVMAIIALLISILLPAFRAILGDKAEQETIDLLATAEIVQVVNGTAAVSVDVPYKIELKPAYVGANVAVHLSNIPENSEIIQENGKYYLFWVPLDRTTLETTIITSAPNLDKQEQKITVMVR